MRGWIHMQRDHTIDILKTLAIFGVIVIHTAADTLIENIGTFQWMAALFWTTLFRAAVPVFFMCSGALFFDPERELTIHRLFSKYIAKILIAMTAWRILYDCFGIGGHLYYLQILILFYAIAPVIRVFILHASTADLRYALSFWFLLGIIYPTVRHFFQIDGIYGQWAINMTYASIGYGMLGYYLKQNPISRNAGIALFLFGFILTYSATYYLSLQAGSLNTAFSEGMSLGPACMAIGIRGIIGHISTNYSFFQSTAKASLCVFFVHSFFLYRFNFTESIILRSGFNLVCSFMVYWVLSKIPFVRKWLI